MNNDGARGWEKEKERAGDAATQAVPRETFELFLGSFLRLSRKARPRRDIMSRV